MHYTLKKTALLHSIAFTGLVAMQNLHAASTLTTCSTAIQTEEADPLWTLVTAYSHSFLNRGNHDWQRESLDLYRYLPEHKLLLGTSVDVEHRSPNGDDVVYGTNASWYATVKLELHGAISLTQDADFLASERYLLGFQYQARPDLELLFDIEQFEFKDNVAAWDDGITAIKPGITWHYREHQRVTLRYIHGWVHDACDFDYYSAKFHFAEMIRDGTVSLGLAYGSDPDIGLGSSTTTLTDAYIVSVFYTEPVQPDLTVFAGIEYIYRMRPDSNGELYQMWTPTIGLSWKF